MARLSLVAALAGLLFGAGLVISGMAFPEKVLAFLSLGPGWDPSLALVMAAALAIAMPAFTLLQRRDATLLGERFSEQSQAGLDRPLLAGAALFGLGWGLAGFCPGPAIVSTGFGGGSAALFTAAMLAGAYFSSRMRG